MTVNLELAIQKLTQSPDEVQDVIASQILEAIEAEANWAQRLKKLPQSLLVMAEEAVAEKNTGLTEDISEL